MHEKSRFFNFSCIFFEKKLRELKKYSTFAVLFVIEAPQVTP